MDSVFLETSSRNLFSPSQQPYYNLSPIPKLQSSSIDLNNKLNPSILLIIIILAIIFFVSGFLHLLVRFLLRPPNRDPGDLESVTVLQGQLQQLFHLHDAGVDQSFIDTLPVFNYKAIIGVKDPFDCAVCLCEFEPEDKLRLLPKCSHAFHIDCIDTWLLSHSSCPTCRACLLPDFSSNNNACSPIVLVLESGSESSREIVSDRELSRTNSVFRTNSHLGFHGDNEFGSSRIDFAHKSSEIVLKDDAPPPAVMVETEEKVVPVKLGKFRTVEGGGGGDGGGGSGGEKNVDARRCFSMGSFEYVIDENTSLQVPIRTPMKKQSSKSHRAAMSECDCESRREFNVFEGFKNTETRENANLSNGKRESFSVSKIWLREKKEKQSSMVDPSRRAFSFRFPVRRNSVAAENGGNELGCDEENQRCNSLDSQANPPSFARRTLFWLVGKQSKVVHSTFSPNV